MYPSGSSSGQVVAEDPSLAARCLAMLEGSEAVPVGANVVARLNRPDGTPVNIIDRRADSYIRGIHYRDEAANLEDEPAAGDILNPRTASAIIRLVYDRFFECFGNHFGKTILGIFTDEPNPLGKSREPNVRPGTTGILEQVNQLIGYDFTPHLAALWDESAESAKYRADYEWALHRRLEQTWYKPLSEWCAAHGVALCGHPDRGDEIGVQRFFQIPGQDLVWRWVLPDHQSAVEGPESTQGKCSSSAMIHLGRRRNSNEFCGAYGHETTFEEFQWLANWCFLRGVNLLIPHAFYFSVKGPRKDERPPQVGGVGCAWWDRFTPFAEHCRRLSWLNTDCRHVCDIAILTEPDQCPWQAAKVLFENQRDFNYLEIGLLESVCEVTKDGIHIAGMNYGVLVIEGRPSLTPAIEKKLAPLRTAGRVVHFDPSDSAVFGDSEKKFIGAITATCTPDIELSTPAKSLRVRHVVREDRDFYLFFNESSEPLSTSLKLWPKGDCVWIDSSTAAAISADNPLSLKLDGWSTRLLQIGR
jgi:hypothetical protein